MISPKLSDPEGLNTDAAAQTNLESDTKKSAQEYAKQIVGAAMFDLSGLPEEYFISTESSDVIWVQTVFQVLGLQALLSASFKLNDFQHATIRGQGYQAIIVKQCSCYTALLLQNQLDFSPELIQWAQAFEPALLKIDSRFSTV
jgi:hypothetical protein